MASFKCVLISLLVLTIFACSGSKAKFELTDLELLGKKVFFDENLSSPKGQSCATCHDPAAGWAGPDSDINTIGAIYPGAVETRFGNRKPPTASYAGDSPALHRDEEGIFIGGMFWDGRATGWETGDPLAEQAMGPFLNHLEHNLPDEKSLKELVAKADYADLYKKVWGKGLAPEDDPKETFLNIARALAAFERSDEVNPFNSLFDDFWRNAGKKGLKVAEISENNFTDFYGLGLSELQVKGLMVFNTKGKCAECHPLTSEDGNPPVFTDFSYDNLGVPRNPANQFYTNKKEFNPEGNKWIDPGLGGFLETSEKLKEFAKENFGKHKVPTLRNVDHRPDPRFVKAYMHNGVFKTLKVVVNFYNTRDTKKWFWPPAEVKENINTDELGNLGLTDKEEDLIVEFMKTLSDRQ